MTREQHLLITAMEECMELAQRLSKALRFGLNEVQPGQPLTNIERIRYEYSDLAATLEMIAPPSASGGMIHPPCVRMMDEKRAKVEAFLRYSESCGTLTAVSPDEGPRETLIEQLRTLKERLSELADGDAREAQDRLTANVVAPANTSYHTALARARAYRVAVTALSALLDAHAPAKGQE